MDKCKTDFKGCCCNVDGECTYWGSCHNQTFENKSIVFTPDYGDMQKLNISFSVLIDQTRN